MNVELSDEEARVAITEFADARMRWEELRAERYPLDQGIPVRRIATLDRILVKLRQ